MRAHVTELNRRMVALIESSEKVRVFIYYFLAVGFFTSVFKGFPSYINVEVCRSIPQPADDQIMWLKRQNKMLTDVKKFFCIHLDK